jgi:3-hydroxyacyl-[acyl-carrier-protein] dehydratase
MQWYSIKNLKQSELSEITADIRVPADSPWFDGHFPAEPILPGVAQLGFVFDMIRRFHDDAVTIAGVRRIRFKQIIRPNDSLKVTVTPLKEDTGSYSFRIVMGDGLACSGVMAVAKQVNDKR